MNKYEILIVDDDKAVANALKCSLELHEIYNPTVVFSGEEAIEIIKTKTYDAYLVDQIMPGISGIEFITELIKEHKEPLVYIITAEDNGIALSSAEKAENEGGLPIHRYIPKPWSPSMFSVDLREDLRERDLKKDFIKKIEDYSRNQNLIQKELIDAQQRIFILEKEKLKEENSLLTQKVDKRSVELSIANAELARAARLKDEFLASMSHELRTPLNTILGMSESLQEQTYGPLNNKQLKSLKSIEESGNHLLSLINDILDISKIEAGKFILTINPVSIESLCRASIRLCEQDAHKKRIKINLNLDNSLKIIKADERRLKQIIVNLLNNAIKFTTEGKSVGINVKADHDKKTINFMIWDKGIGIEKNNLKLLFEPFVQLDSKLSKHFTGTGLGLSLVYRLTEMHNGSVKVESSPGEGSCFTITIPWELHDEDEIKKENIENLQNIDIGENSFSKNNNYTVLIAEDSKANIYMTSTYLISKGYHVITAMDGQEAIEKTSKSNPDIILMDIQMPKMDGLEAINILKSKEKTKSIPIIALTALTMPGDNERCLEAGADKYLSKPISLKNLNKLILTLVKNKTIQKQ